MGFSMVQCTDEVPCILVLHKIRTLDPKPKNSMPNAGDVIVMPSGADSHFQVAPVHEPF